MSEIKHTPGPWIRDGVTIYTLRKSNWAGCESLENEWTALFSRDGKHITSHETVLANARLAQAAPELLEALEAIYNSINLPPGLEKKATEAIQKARGEALKNGGIDV